MLTLITNFRFHFHMSVFMNIFNLRTIALNCCVQVSWAFFKSLHFFYKFFFFNKFFQLFSWINSLLMFLQLFFSHSQNVNGNNVQYAHKRHAILSWKIFLDAERRKRIFWKIYSCVGCYINLLNFRFAGGLASLKIE